MPGMPSVRGMQHKTSYDGNYERYQNNLSALFGEDGKMSPCEDVEKPLELPICIECVNKDGLCGRSVFRNSTDCRERNGQA